MKVPETPGYYWCKLTTNSVWRIIRVMGSYFKDGSYSIKVDEANTIWPDAEFSWRLLSPAEQEIHQNGELHKEIERLKDEDDAIRELVSHADRLLLQDEQ